MKTLVVANPKGGVGKSLVSILAIEWFTARGVALRVIDADQNENVQDWLDFCRQAGRAIPQSAEPELEIVDTAGLPNAVTSFLHRATVVLTPFRGLTPDVARLVKRWWFTELGDEERAKIHFIPNMMRLPVPTKDQVAAFEMIQQLLGEDGRVGQMLPGLTNREAVYGSLFNGSSENFFERPAEPRSSLANAQSEARSLFERVSSAINL